jgi:DNA-binding MarR family transcriptional regulator
MTVARFDEVIHPGTRLSIVAVLAAADWVEFSFIRDHLGLSDSALSKQLSTLQEVGYVDLNRDTNGQRRRVRVRLTPAGRAALQGHVAALNAIVARASPHLPRSPTADAGRSIVHRGRGR